MLSPFLFNLYAERIMRKVEREEANEGVKIAGGTLNNLRYADDTTSGGDLAPSLGRRKFFFADQDFRMTFFRKQFPFLRPKILMTFFRH